MADDAGGNALPGIAALPPTTVRQLGSHQLLTDPSSVVKELIDNALDARAKSIFVDITANTIDSIQVKDDGHGIPDEDRALACRRYCTSKIRDFHDLKQVAGKWLGFRGEALASIADISGTVSITTRVEGEPVAVKLTYQRNGELVSTERESHPIGTTVKITKLLESAKVRMELAVKNSAKCLIKIRRLVQAYALAKPSTRFRLHVLKAKNNKGDFVYAPTANANVEDAAFKVIGKDCVLQCDWTALEMGGFELHAYLPKHTAVGSKVAHHGAFISVDSRPVSATGGTIKKIATGVRNRLRKADWTLANVKDPFFCMNIICPTDSYDPNIEPAKDNVIFSDESFVLALVDRLLVSYYPEDINTAGTAGVIEREDEVVTKPVQTKEVEEKLPQSHRSFPVDQNNPIEEPVVSMSATQTQQPRWRPSMYGVDEEDLEFLKQNSPAPLEEDEGCRNAAISNPWTIARMNAPVKPRRPLNNGQLLSPAKSLGNASTIPSSPTPVATPRQSRSVEPLTPEVVSEINVHESPSDAELQRSIQRLPRIDLADAAISSHASSPQVNRASELTPYDERMFLDFVQPASQASISSKSFADTAKPRRNPRSRQLVEYKPFVPSALQSNNTWFRQPVRNAPKATRPHKGSREKRPAFFSHDDTFGSQRSLVLPAAERVVETRLASESNTDIRNFFSKSRRELTDAFSSVEEKHALTQDISDQLRAHGEQKSPARCFPRRLQSTDSYQHSTDTAQDMEKVFQYHGSSLANQVPNLIRNSEPLDAASAAQTAPHPHRRRTTDSGLHQTKSSTLPLNYISHGSEIQALSLIVNIRISSITHQARNLDMTINNLDWGYNSTDAFDVFGTPVSEHKIMEWAVKVDNMLHSVFERVDGVECRGALHDGIQRFLDSRKEEQENDDKHAVAATKGRMEALSERKVTLQDIDSGVHALANDFSEDVANVRGNTATTDAAIESDEYKEDLDLAQAVDPGGDVKPGSPVRVVKTEDEFGDGIDDDMLMDL